MALFASTAPNDGERLQLALKRAEVMADEGSAGSPSSAPIKRCASFRAIRTPSLIVTSTWRSGLERLALTPSRQASV